jgi:hypothetical protein
MKERFIEIFKKYITRPGAEDLLLCFEASTSESRYEIHLDGSEREAYCRLCVGSAVFL